MMILIAGITIGWAISKYNANPLIPPPQNNINTSVKTVYSEIESYPIPITDGFAKAPSLPGPTSAHSATVMDNGEIVVIGGYAKMFDKVPIASTGIRIFNPEKSQWRTLGSTLINGRFLHSALKLPNNKILIAGGKGQHGKNLKTMELYDYNTGKVTTLPDLPNPVFSPGLNLLNNNEVLITGGSRQATILSWNPAGKYTTRPTKNQTNSRHINHDTINLPNGQVLIIAGRSTAIELFNPENEVFTQKKTRLPNVFDDLSVSLLNNGKILIAGAQLLSSGRCIDKTWLYDYQSDILTEGPTLKPTSDGKTLPGLSDLAAVDIFANDPNRKGTIILLAGGEYDPGNNNQNDTVLDSAWLYYSDSNTLVNIGPMPTGHDDFSAVPLPPTQKYQRIMLISGYNYTDTIQGNCHIYYYTH
ncbi:MAG: hypothetical protein JEZ07_10780 [Phycisphaerae bacterium]|nr:hypothetical protein [Phycisphaerae bacterium]